MPNREIWRIATDTPDYEADDLTGAGAKRSGGRWNRPGVPMVYASETRALACLETLVHLNSGGLPLNRYLVRISVPEESWKKAEVVDGAALIGWDAEPAAKRSIDFGTEWVTSKRSLLLIVPSMIVSEERNFLINAEHPSRRLLRAVRTRKWTYDPRLGRSA